MANVKVLIGGTIYNLENIGTVNPSSDIGKARLNIRINSTSTERFGFTTNSTASQYCKLRFRVGGKEAWLGTIGATGSARTTITGSNYNSVIGEVRANFYNYNTATYYATSSSVDANGVTYSSSSKYTTVSKANVSIQSTSGPIYNASYDVYTWATYWTKISNVDYDTYYNGNTTISRSYNNTSGTSYFYKNERFSYKSTRSIITSWTITRVHYGYKFAINKASTTWTNANWSSASNYNQKRAALINNGAFFGDLWRATHAKSLSAGTADQSSKYMRITSTENYRSSTSIAITFTNAADTAGYANYTWSQFANQEMPQVVTGSNAVTTTNKASFKYGLSYQVSNTINYNLRSVTMLYTQYRTISSNYYNVYAQQQALETRVLGTNDQVMTSVTKRKNDRMWILFSNLWGCTSVRYAHNAFSINETYSSLGTYSARVSRYGHETYWAASVYRSTIKTIATAPTNINI